MYERTTFARVEKTRLDEFVKLWREEVMPVVRVSKGNWRELLNQDIDDPESLVIFSVWHEKEYADRFDELWGFARVMEMMRPYFKEEPETRIFQTVGYSQPLTPLWEKFRPR